MTFAASNELQAPTSQKHRDLTVSRAVALLVLATLGSLLAGCTKSAPEQAPKVSVRIAVAQKTAIRRLVTADAVLFPIHQAAITPKISAPVKQFLVNRGSPVKEGQLLAVLENTDLNAAEVETRGSYQQAQADYDRNTGALLGEELRKAELDLHAAQQTLEAEQKVYDSRENLFQQGALPRKDLDQSRVSLIQTKNTYEIAKQHYDALQASGHQLQKKSAEGQLTAAKGHHLGAAAQLAYSEIRSPINGYVTERPLYPGEMAAAGTPLLTVMDLSKIIAKAHMPQADAGLLKPGDEATLEVPGADVPVAGKVTLVSPAVDQNSTTIEVWVEAANPKHLLKPGMTARVVVVAKEVADAVAVPASAVLTGADGATTVMLVSSDLKAATQKVEVGIRQGNLVQITTGVKPGDRVVTAGAFALPDGTAVKLIEDAASDEKPAAVQEDKSTKPGAKED